MGRTKKGEIKPGMPEGGTATRVCFVMDKDIYRELRMASLSQNVTISEIMRQASLAFLRRYSVERVEN